MRTRSGIRWLLFLVLMLAPAALAEEPSADQIDRAIERGKQFLYSISAKDVFWDDPNKEISETQPAGQTALAVLALVSADEKPTNALLAEAIAKLRTWKTDSVYAVGMRATLFSMLPSTRENVAVRLADRAFLMNSVFRDKTNLGLYGYFPPEHKSGNFAHMSPSNYGVLGAWALADSGQDIPANYWTLMNQTWRRAQQRTGAWQYRLTGGPPDQHVDTITMTSAGVASLLICEDFLVTEIKGNPIDPALDAGLAWIDKNWALLETIGWRNYGFYNMERIGVASGLRRIGSHDWYAEGAATLLRQQNGNGAWAAADATASTSFAILFLTHGRAPVMLNKLEYNVLGRDKKPVLANWNQRPRDAANLVLWAKRQLERDLRWQRITLASSVGELLESPILYIAGDQKLDFTEPELNRLRDFCNAGGIILGIPDRGDVDFSKSFRELGGKLFKTYEFRRLGDSHPIFTSQLSKASSWKRQVPLEALGNGAREMLILIPDADPAKFWNSRQADARPEAFQVAANIYLYSVARDHGWQRGRGYYVPPVSNPTGSPRKIVRLRYKGNWNPEPYGWTRLQAILSRPDQGNLALTIDSIDLGVGKLKGAKLAHLTGTATFELDRSQRDELKQFVQEGGTLLVDACGGSPEFGASALSELKQIFGKDSDALDVPIKATSPILEQWGTKIPKLEFREFALTRGSIPSDGLALRVIPIQGRPAVIFSTEDLSTALTGTPVDAIAGYTPASAIALLRNIVNQCGK